MKSRKLVLFMLLLVFASSVNLIGDVLINEFDTSTWSAEYIELYNPTDAAIDLSAGQYVLVFVNGYDESIYQATDLTGTIPANGYYVVAESGVTDIEGYTPDQNATWTSFQNGADGVALIKGETAANLSSGDYATTLAASAGTQIDAIIYGGIDTELNTAFGTADINITISDDGSSSRITDGQGDAAPNYANSDWTTQVRTPGATNVLPLAVTSAVSVSLTEVEVQYTGDVSAVDVADYSVLGTAGINFTTATIDPDDPSIVILTADADIVGDTVLDTLVDAACSDSVVLYIGITPIALLNTANPSGTIENGYLASFEGIVSANDGYNNVWVSSSDGAYNGALIYDYDFDLAADVGDEIVFSAERAVYNNLTELKNPVLIETISTGNVPYGPDLITGADIDTSLAADTDPAEQYEGQLVKIEGALVESYTDYQYICTDDGGATHFIVGDEVDYHFGNISMTVGETYDIVGVVDYKNKYRLNPRDIDDITSLTVVSVTDYTIAEIQDTTGTGSADSPKDGEMVRTTGIVTGVFSGKYTLQDGNGGFSGIWVDDDLTVTVGDEVTVKGVVSESYNLTIITADSSGVNSSGNVVPDAEVLATGDVSAEEWEGVLVTVTGACDNADLGYGEWSVDDGSGSIRMDDLGYAFTPTVGTEYTITGPLYYSYSNFKIVPRDADDIVEYVPPSNDLNLTFEDDSDVANWGVYDGASGWTTVSYNATGGVDGTGALEFGDGGYSFYIKRPVSGTVGTDFLLTVDVKTSGWDDATTYPITISVEGLGDTPVSASINALAEFTTITLTGTITNADGYIVIAGSNTELANNVWIDNLIWDDDAEIPDTDPPIIMTVDALNDTTVLVEFSEDIDVVTGETLTNYVIDHEIGSPTAATVFENTVTLTVDPLEADTIYIMTVNNIEDLSGNVIATDTEVPFMWQPWTPGPDLMFSEYIEGSGNNKALELYNPTDEDIDLSGYAIVTGSSGGGYWYDPAPLSGILPSGDTYVIINPDFDFSLIDSAAVVDSIWGQYVTWFNGDDPRAIGKLLSGDWSDETPNYVIIDAIGDINGDPGTAWDVAGVTEATANHTLIRKAELIMGNPDWSISAGTDEASSEWVVLPEDVVQFLGSHPHDDLEGPEIIGVVAIADTLIQVKFSEEVDSAAAVTVTNYVIDGGIGSPVSAEMINSYIVILTYDADHYLAPNMDYTLTVNNIPDLIGNIILENTTLYLRWIAPGDLPIDIVSTDFEADMGTWQIPTYSGSTSGILETSTFALSDEAVFDGTKSAKMTILDNDAISGGWFVRVWNSGRPDVSVGSKVFVYVKASDPDIQVRFVFKDDGTGGDGEYLAGPWIDVTYTEDDWQVVGVDLLSTPLESWVVVGDGMITSTDVISIDCIQLQCPNDVDAVLYFDKLTERPNLEPVEVTFEVSMAVQALLGNFNIASDFVDVAGTFNGWGETPMVLDDADGDSVYTITLYDLYPGEELEYKFRINGSWDDNTAEFPYGGPARVYTVPDTNSVVFHWYNDQDRSALGIDDMNALPKTFALHQNYPNPFNPITTIKYDLPKESHVKIIIYDIMGREVRTLVNARQQAGYQTIQWNALDNNGRRVSSGYYIYVMQADKYHKTQKMILLK